MQQVRKLAKIQQWFLQTIKKAPSKVKEKEQKQGMDENKIDKQYFCKILDYISEEANITPPTELEKHQLFEQFNNGKSEENIIKEEFEVFMERIGLMLQSTLNN